MRPKLTIAFALLASLLLPINAGAWNKPGHMVVGAIAFNELKESHPEVIRKVIALLERNPFFPSNNKFFSNSWEERIKALGLTGSDRDLFLFAFAARWPDDARGTQFHVERAHFVNFQFRPPSMELTDDPNKNNILKLYNDHLATMKRLAKSNTAKSRQSKAIALSWIFHLIGDIHQPLHATAFFSDVFPQGDQGGNLWFVKIEPDKGTIRLHTFWDGLVFGPDDFRGASQRAILLRANPSFSRDKLPELSEKQFEKWANPESGGLAVEFAYVNGSLQQSKSESNPASVPSDYVGKAQPVAQRRAVLAGYRLADLLVELFGQP